MAALEHELDSRLFDRLERRVQLTEAGRTLLPHALRILEELTDLRRSVQQLPEEYQDDVTTLFVSVDPRRDTPERLASYVSFFGEGIVGLTAEEPTLRKLAKRYRTTFGYDQPDANGNYNVSHSSAVYVFDRSGSARLLLRPGLSPEQISEDLAQLARESG